MPFIYKTALQENPGRKECTLTNAIFISNKYDVYIKCMHLIFSSRLLCLLHIDCQFFKSIMVIF